MAGRLSAAYAAESDRRLATMRHDLQALQNLPEPEPAARQRLLHKLVSEVHSLKGAADAAGVAVAHTLAERLERLFEQLRDDELQLGPAVGEPVLRALATIDAAREPGGAGPAAGDVAALVAELDDAPARGGRADMHSAAMATPPALAGTGAGAGHELLVGRLEALLTAVGDLTAATAEIQRRVAGLDRELRDLLGLVADDDQAPAIDSPVERAPAIVLLVENSETTRALQKHLLEGAGHQVRPAADGAEAWSLLATEPVDCVISDILMPGLDGLELTARIRADERLRDLPVILITATDDPARRARADQIGADAYLVKGSVEHQNLAQMVERLS